MMIMKLTIFSDVRITRSLVEIFTHFGAIYCHLIPDKSSKCQ